MQYITSVCIKAYTIKQR